MCLPRMTILDNKLIIKWNTVGFLLWLTLIKNKNKPKNYIH